MKQNTKDVTQVDIPVKMRKKRRLCTQIALLVIGVTLVIIGITIFIQFEAIYEAILKNALNFSPDSKAFTVWRKNDPPLDVDFYLFNWTNTQDFKNTSIKPKFQQLGPFRYKEVKEKVNITWHNNNNTISYRHRKSLFYYPGEDETKLEQIINTINAVPLVVSHQYPEMNFFTRRMISMTLSSVSNLFVTTTVRKMLFDGYEEGLLDLLHRIPFMSVKDKFGLYYGRNGTVGIDGVYSMYTKNDEKFGNIMTWNYKNKTNFYEGDCNNVTGSAGEFYPLNRKMDFIVLYSPELCRYAVLEYEKNVTIKGVKGYKYTAKNIFDNGTTRPENKCFCKNGCLPSGVLDVSACRENSPMYLSMPHFYNADSYYIDNIEGLNPDADKHEFYIIMEPKSGIAMEVAARMQLNMLLKPVESLRLYEDVPRMFVPVFFFDQKINLSDELAGNLRMIQNLPEYANYFVLIISSLGIVLILWAACAMFCCCKNAIAEEKEKQDTVEEIPLKGKKSISSRS